MKKLTIYILILLMCLSACSASHSNTYKVQRIVDGDTFVIKINNKYEKVRLIGIDTPETVKPDSPVEYFGPQASAFTKKLIDNKYITLEFDVQKRDKYGRLLAYVYLDNDKMLNEILLKKGFAKTMTI